MDAVEEGGKVVEKKKWGETLKLEKKRSDDGLHEERMFKKQRNVQSIGWYRQT